MSEADIYKKVLIKLFGKENIIDKRKIKGSEKVMKLNLGLVLDRIEGQRTVPEPTWVSFNPEIKQSTRDRLERVRLGLMDYRLHVLHSKPRLKGKKFKSLKLFGGI